MPLQFRRGTNSDRTSITPSVGEPVFTTDTKKLFVGDGSTAGGIAVTGTDSAVTQGIIDSSHPSLFDTRFATKLKDEDNMASNSASHVASQQSVKAYVDARILTVDNTDEMTEGSTNLYFTNARADARITNAIKDEDNMASNSATHIPSQQSVKAYVDAQILTKDNTDEITEGSTNKYYTAARADSDAKNAISVTDAGGDGSLAYNSSTGVITYTGPSAAEVQAHITAGEGIDISSGVVSGEDATTTNKGIASFATADFSVSSGAVTIKAGGVSNSQLANSAITINGSATSLGGSITISGGADSAAVQGIVDSNLTNGRNATLGNIAGTLTTAAQPNITSLGTLTSMTTEGNISMGDNDELRIGAGNDIKIFHNSTESRIENHTGILRLSGTDIRVNSIDQSKTSAFFETTAGVTLQYNGSQKFETTTGGINVTGNIVVSGTVDGRDLATDGTKLDGIATSATANAITNGGNDRILTSTGGTAANAEADFQFDGTNLFIPAEIRHLGDPDTKLGFTTDTITLTAGGSTAQTITSASTTIGGNAIITGNLTVNGTTTTINSTTMDVDDLNITVAKGAADAAAANGAGLTVDGASATILYQSSGDKWALNKPLDLGANNLTTTGQLLYKNMYATEGDLPNATTYHGMFAHVHATGKGYFAHGGNWIKLLDETSSTTANLTEGTNKYYTSARVDSDFDVRLATKSTTNLSEGTNKYMTTARVDSDVNIHLNTSTASSGEVLSWTGSDYDWVAQSGGGGSSLTVQEEGSSLSTAATTLNFVGSGVTASGSGATKTITVSAGGSLTVQDEGSSLSTAGTTLNFVGAGVVASGTGATKTITIAGGGGGGGSAGLASYEYTAIAGQTAFSGNDLDGASLSFDANSTAVFLNGILLKHTDDYIESAGSNRITLTGAADSQDIVTVQVFSGGGGGGVDSATTIALIDSDYVRARQAATLTVTSSANSVKHFEFSADSGQTAFSGNDGNGETLRFSGNDIIVSVNGIMLKETTDYIESAASNKITLTSVADSADLVTITKIIGGAMPLKTGTLHYSYTATNNQTAFTGADASGTVMSFIAGQIQVHLNGILLKETNDYTVTGTTTITLTQGASTNDILQVTSFASIGGGVQKTENVASAGQTSFTGRHDVNNSLVFVNGILMADSDYTDNGGASITLTDSAAAGDIVQVVNIQGMENPDTGLTWQSLKTSAYTMEAGQGVFVNSTSGAVTIKLPPAPISGNEVRIIDAYGTAATNNITIDRNGKNIHGAADNLTVDVNRSAVGLVYCDTTQGWIMLER